MHTTATMGLTAHAIDHALNRHIPDMGRGFSIVTNYGELAIEPGSTAKRIAALLERALRADLAKLGGVQ